ncbi:endonuclease I family protein [Pseudomonas sp.]|uniref:endonuclease I family protein n=1 Tax=Pseudomonas sp. TaxID=306 RepID=UPI00257CCB00|nr:endonuclease I family protein [Pseudomonas sp.]
MLVRAAIALFFITFFSFAYANPPRTFSEAKKIGWKLYARQSVEFYCGCKFTGNRVDLKSCGYKPRKNAKRAQRIEWEHIVAAWEIGHQRQCWQKGGRKNCSKNDDVYRLAEADLHNLVPAIGEVNGDRSNFTYGWLPQKPSQYGACPVVVDFKARKAMPRQKVRGMVARTYLYMSDRYKLRLSSQNRKLFNAWNKAYPVEPWERQRNQLVGCVMGWGNPYVGKVNQQACSKQLLGTL